MQMILSFYTYKKIPAGLLLPVYKPFPFYTSAVEVNEVTHRNMGKAQVIKKPGFHNLV
jgi:hypothetical protein